MNKSLIIITVAMLYSMVLQAVQHHPFYSQYYYDEGLPDVAIQCCVQDEFGRIWIGSRGEGVYYYTGSRFIQLKNEDFLASCSQNIITIIKDYDQNIWIGTSDGIGRYDLMSDSFIPLDELKGLRIHDIDVDTEGNVWITTNYGIWRYSREDGLLSLKIQSDDFTPFRACISDNNDLIFTAANNYIYIYDINTESLRQIKARDDDSEFKHIDFVEGSTFLVSNGSNSVCTIDTSNGETFILADSTVIETATVNCVLSKNGQYWIGTTFGLVLYDPATGEIERQFPDELNSASLGGEFIYALYQDVDGNMWACTNNGGLRCWMSYDSGFSRFNANDPSNSLEGNTVRAICNDNSDNIWIGSEEGYLCRFDPSKKTFQDFTKVSKIPNGTAITDITLIGSLLWITTSGSGIYVFDPLAGCTVKHYELPSKFCMSVLESSDGNIYAGTKTGLYKHDLSTDTFNKVDVVGEAYVRCILEDKKSCLILGTTKGVGIYNIRKDTYNINVLETRDNINNLFFDSKDVLWVATDGSGVCRVTENPNGTGYSVQRFDRSNGMPSNRAGGVVEDEDGILWISTTNGLVEFDPDLLSVRKIFMQNDKVLGSKFSFGGDYTSNDKIIYMGASNGMLVFDPQYIKLKFKGAPLHITDIVTGYLDKRISIAQEDRSAITSDNVRIKQKDAQFISISFSGMVYSNPNVEKYVCTLTGPGVKSSLTTTTQMINYTNLRPGTYQFSVNYADSEDTSTMAGIEIIIIAPFLKSKVALSLYLILAIVLIFMLIRNKIMKDRRENERRLELEQAKKEKNLAHDKMDFFTNVAHEIRTPVSVILILLEKFNNSHKVPKEVQEDLQSIQMNAERLKKQCDDLLDFRKVENGQSKMVFIKEDIRLIAEKSVKTFNSAAIQRGVTLLTELPDAPVEAVCDSDAIESILCNLLSNAIKYGSTQAIVTVRDHINEVEVRVNNNGTHINAKEREKIFEAFYRGSSTETGGTGLGLTYSRQIANLHKGKLFVDPDVQDENSFVLILPKKANSPTNPKTEENIEASSGTGFDESIFEGEQKAIVLVVEDNETMRNLIRDELSKTYDILVACNGKEALEKVRNDHVDLVVSDIMMPLMDGCELCDTIKADIQLSHIPVLLLTAAVGVETHIKSLKSGADAYIEKPFKMDILVATISNLFRNRDIRNKQFSSYPLSHINYTSFSKVDQDFMNSLHTYIIDNISDTDLTIDKLSDVMAVSRNTLSRKVKANLGVTVNEYVRICRLKKAVELLTENTYRINEVAYLVGYSSSSYFTKNFQKQFGVLPSEFINKD